MRPGTSVSGSCLLSQSSSPGLTLLLRWGRSPPGYPGGNLLKCVCLLMRHKEKESELNTKRD